MFCVTCLFHILCLLTAINTLPISSTSLPDELKLQSLIEVSNSRCLSITHLNVKAYLPGLSQKLLQGSHHDKHHARAGITTIRLIDNVEMIPLESPYRCERCLLLCTSVQT